MDAPRCLARRIVVLCATFAVWLSAPLWARESAGYYNQLLLIRGLAHEVAVAKIPLPWGKHGIHVNGHGVVDQAQAVKQLRSYGESVKPGTPVEVTYIKFKRNRMVFVINGGGKSGFHWWQHLEIGMGPDLGPMVSGENTTPSNGSYITLYLPSGDPNPTVKQVKALLGEVLDFSRRSPTVLYSPAEPPQFKQAIKNHQVMIGMNRAAVLSAKGPPDRKIRTTKPDGTEEDDWLYGKPPHVLFVIFNDESVVAIHQY